MSKRTRHATYHIHNHFVWCPTYRRAVLEGPVADRLAELLPEFCREWGGETLEGVIRPDHVHLIVSFPPTLAPSQIAFRLKGRASRELRKALPFRESRLPSRWTRSYYVGTAGPVSSETIRKYIEAQKGQ